MVVPEHRGSDGEKLQQQPHTWTTRMVQGT